MTEPTQSAQGNGATEGHAGVRAALADFAQSVVSPRILFSSLIAASIVAVLNITAAVSVGALVFSGPLSSNLAMGIGVFLVGNAISAILVPIGSAYRANIASVRSGQAPIFAAIAAAIALSMPDQSAESIAVSVIVGILLATMLSGLVMLMLGWARLGGFARYIPYPVMGGFFAGLGYLTALGGVTVAVGPLASTSDPASFANAGAWVLLVPAVVFAALLLVVERWIRHWLLVPVYMLLAALVFYGVLGLMGVSLSQATADHWLPNLSGEGLSFFPVVTPDQLALVDWSAVLAQSATFAVLALLSVVMLLLDVSGIEIVINRDLDPNRELRAAGAANLVTGLGSGALAFQSLADVSFAHKLGGDRFLMILVYATLCVAVILVGPDPIGFVPNFILGGLLIYVGLDLLRKWVLTARRKLPLADYIVVLVILVVVALYGILEGVGIGIALATILFVHRYSQLDIVRSSMIGSEYVTKTDRAPSDQAHLDANGPALRLFLLQGFLFFGTASRLLERIKANLATPGQQAARFVVIDFRRVDAMDTSAVNCFAKLMQVCRRDGITLVLCDCDATITRALSSAGRELDLAEGAIVFLADLEAGVSWCNDAILRDLTRPGVADSADATALLASLLGDADAAAILAPSFQKIEAAADTVLFRQNDPGDALYLVLKGSVAIHLELPNGQSVMVRAMREGAVIGEMALYSGAARSATGVLREDSTLLRLDAAEFEALQLRHPGPFGQFHSHIIRLMSDRIARANREIAALSR